MERAGMLEISSQNHETDLNLSFNPKISAQPEKRGYGPLDPRRVSMCKKLMSKRLSAVEQSDSHSRINHSERDALFFGMSLDSAHESLQSPDFEPRNLLVLSLPSFRTRPAKQENDGRLASLASLPWWVRSGAPFWTLGLYR